jgi:hypothetical protein
MDNLQWGVPQQRTKKVEKFNTSVITMSSLAKKGAGRKFSFNKAAIEALGLEGGESYITFGFDPKNGIVVLASKDETPSALKITKSFSVSNKKTFEYIAKTKELDTEVENYLHLVTVEGQPYMEVSMIEVGDGSEPSATTEEEETVEAIPEDSTSEEIDESVEEKVEEVETEETW